MNSDQFFKIPMAWIGEQPIANSKTTTILLIAQFLHFFLHVEDTILTTPDTIRCVQYFHDINTELTFQLPRFEFIRNGYFHA